MRLLDSRTLRLVEFFGASIPKYAILSHRWEDEEVSLQETQTGVAKDKKGYRKIESCCRRARLDGHEWVWIDTCCIDKTSSAELSEAINSMFRWYQRAQMCYAYLSDVRNETADYQGEAWTLLDDFTLRALNDSLWFTRGWTLQELIAPDEVTFCDKDWCKIGTKTDLGETLSSITGIDVSVFDPWFSVDSFSIAQRMSWASNRQTTRTEDMAYCLLGIFGINMPLLYGEGSRAFIRLQEEIMKHSDDHSLFAWQYERTTRSGHGLLADSPSEFKECSRIIVSKSILNRIPYLMTNMGLSIELLMIPYAMDTYLAALDCESDSNGERTGIFLKKLPENNQFARVVVDNLDWQTFKARMISDSHYRRIYVRQMILPEASRVPETYGFYIRRLPLRHETSTEGRPAFTLEKVTSCMPNKKWYEQDRLLEIPTGSRGAAGRITFTSSLGESSLELGFDHKFSPVCLFRGLLWGVSGTRQDRLLNLKIEPEWMRQECDLIWLGEPRTGLYYVGAHWHISIERDWTEASPEQMWVVDIEYLTSAVIAERWDEPLHGRTYICDNCDKEIEGTIFHCLDCSDFDYCSQCFAVAKDTHPPHNFKALQQQPIVSTPELEKLIREDAYTIPRA